MTVTKQELTYLVSEHMNVSSQKAFELVDMFFEEIKQALVDHGAFQISGVGKFTVKEKKARKGRNPATGDTMILDARKVVTFHHSAVLKERLNK